MRTVVSIQHPDRFFIDGAWVMPSSDSMFEVRDSATEEVFIRVAEAQVADVERAVTAARKAFDEGPWPRMQPSERGDYLRALAAGLNARGQELAIAQVSETGTTWAFAQATAPHSGNFYSYYAGLADSFEFVAEYPAPFGADTALLVREPVGVVGAIVPWNAPVSAASLKVAPALLAGCTVVVKSAPEAPTAMYVLAEVAAEIGLPPGVLNCITADREVSEALVQDRRVDKISFTGSAVAGRRIASLCGERMARFTLELGGKSAGVILDDYDVGKVAEALAVSAIRMTGQTCASITRLIVNRSRHDELVEALASGLSTVRVGDPFDQQTQMGPLAMARQRDRVEHYISRGIAEGGSLACGGQRPAHLDRGYFVQPTVFGNVDNASTIAQEEIFGPVLSVIPARDERHAIELANDTVYGLNNVVFTNDTDRAFATARQLRSGTVGHNAAMYGFEIAFGGVKQSGVGREGGREGLLPYLESKTVLLSGRPSSLQAGP
ncbi:MAG: aldehyde dehydrogenase [Pseudonocardiales bacterium]|nr:aldehyde dehydrogenase [Pseudonocardiales bacterium]